MTDIEQINAAKNFSAKWNGCGNEKSDVQNFWTTLLNEVFGIDKPFDIIKFEQNIAGHYIDAVISSTKVLIEQKSHNVELDKKYQQSDGKMLTPFEQAKRYVEDYNRKHNYSDYIKWIVTCNFTELRIYDVRNSGILFANIDNDLEPTMTIKLKDLYNNLQYLKFLVDPNDETHKHEIKISKTAAKIIRDIRDKIKNDYPQNYINYLNTLCIRLVFMFYADDAKLFDDGALSEYLKKYKYRRDSLQNLFDVLKQKHRSEDLNDDLKKFPYVNGGLFAEDIYIPEFNEEHDFIINRSSITEVGFDDFKNFSWKWISPTIFGAMFEAILNNDSRRKGGMHYTSPENIHKVIDPLFMNDLHARFKKARRIKNETERSKLLRQLQIDMSNMIFLDPACGSGNFLTETYISLRNLENDIILELHKGNIDMLEQDPIKVHIEQFYGIEINNYACAVAQVALLISDNQMFQRTEAIVGPISSGLPLSKYDQIKNANALQIDWNEVVQRDKLTYIIGNPPFIGRRYRSREQVTDIEKFFSYKDVDYVACWYKKAADFTNGTNIRCAFVSTNSICQGEQVTPIWKSIFAQGMHIDFAYRTFKWTSESDKMAAVHCVIISFSEKYRGKKYIYDGEAVIKAKNINAYLMDADNIFIEIRNKPLCNVPEMHNGNMPADGKHLMMDAETYADFIKREPTAKKYIKRLVGAEEFINGKIRYCLWLVNCTKDEIAKMPLVAERVEAVRNFRLNSTFKNTNIVNTPHLFRDLRNPANFIIVPAVSSENRRYIPMGFLNSDYITTTQVQIIPDATVYEFGVLISSVHMAWTRAVCGRLESRYRYSKDIVYNNFVWCEATAEQRAEIERTGQGILNVLERYKDKTLAWLYNDKTMPEDLRLAHEANDSAVKAAYKFSDSMSEAEIVSELFKLYSKLVYPPPYSTKLIHNFLTMEVTAGEVLQTVYRWKYYQFGVLTSKVHMAWTRVVCGRLKSDYRYSKDIVYNNFPFVNASVEQKAAIELTAENILKVRAGHAGKTLAWLYNDTTMPDDLKIAHMENDVAVMAAYGFDFDMSEAKIVEALFKMYKKLTI